MTTAISEGLQSFLDDPFDDGPFGSEEERKERNKQANIEACGKRFSQTMDWSGERKTIVLKCKYHRECNPCAADKYDNEIEPRLSYAYNHLKMGDRLSYLIISGNEKMALFKRINRHKCDYYSFPQSDDQYIVIHDDPSVESNELWDYGYDDHDIENEGNGFDLNFFPILKNIPEGKKITGNLGKKKEEEPGDGDGQQFEDEDEEKTAIRRPCLYQEGLSDRNANLAFIEAVKKTQNIKVETVLELEQAMFKRLNAMNDVLQGKATVFFTWDAISDGDVKLWNDNPNNFSDVQIITLGEGIQSSNSDKYANPNYKQTRFDAVMDRSKRGDDLDSERDQAIQDFLKQHWQKRIS
jgi:hypothetical protein